eukprot:3244521-Heterocapsa_arctica.AAC.1
MQPAAAGRTMGAGKPGARRKWMVMSDIRSYIVPPNIATPRQTPASDGMWSRRARASAGQSGFCVKNGC